MPIEATDLLVQLLHRAEQEKAQLARELHDDMGGMLMASVMDLAWIEQHAGATLDPDSRTRFTRVQQCLRTAIDLKRTIIEQLRPSLLDNFGLFAALRWVLGNTCRDAGLVLVQDYPGQEPRFDPQAAITIYRVLQSALAIVLARASIDRAELTVGVDADEVTFRFSGTSGNGGNGGVDGTTVNSHRLSHGSGREEFELAIMQHRLRELRGDVTVARKPDLEDIAMTARIALDAATFTDPPVAGRER